jgi:hypothetical protein
MNADQFQGGIWTRFRADLDEYREYQHSPMTIAGIASEGVTEWLEREGLAVIKVGDVPPWMERADAIKLGQGRTETGFGGLVMDDEVYRLSPVPTDFTCKTCGDGRACFTCAGDWRSCNNPDCPYPCPDCSPIPTEETEG